MWQQFYHQALAVHKVKAHRTLGRALRDGDYYAYVANTLADAAAAQGVLLYRDRPAEDALGRELGVARLALRRVLAIEHARYLAQPTHVPP